MNILRECKRSKVFKRKCFYLYYAPFPREFAGERCVPGHKSPPGWPMTIRYFGGDAVDWKIGIQVKIAL